MIIWSLGMIFNHEKENFTKKCDLETLLQQYKAPPTKDFTLTLPNTNDQIYITVDSSLIGIGCVIFQMNDEGKLVIMSEESRFFLFHSKRTTLETNKTETITT